MKMIITIWVKAMSDVSATIPSNIKSGITQ